jgi:hypothetical protein
VQTTITVSKLIQLGDCLTNQHSSQRIREAILEPGALQQTHTISGRSFYLVWHESSFVNVSIAVYMPGGSAFVAPETLDTMKARSNG